jgi:predicted PurR-regulated permease PerM
MEMLFHKNRNIILLTIIVLSFGIVLFPFLNVVGASIVTAYFAHPLFRTLSRRFRQSITLLFTWIAIIISIVAPLSIIGTISYYQMKQIVKETSAFLDESQTGTLRIPNADTNPIASYLQSYIDESQDEFSETSQIIGDWTQKIGEKILVYLGSFAKEIPFTIIKIILYTFLTTSLLIR